MNIKLVDVTIHVDDPLDAQRRETAEAALRAKDGMVSVHFPDNRPHLITVEYNPDKLGSREILHTVTNLGLRAELVGL